MDNLPLIERVEADLRVGGALSRALPGYEDRPAQIKMARRIARSLERDEHIVVAGGDGDGEIPGCSCCPSCAPARSRCSALPTRRSRNSSSTKISRSSKMYIQPFEAALVKGMGNYLCLDRLGEERAFQALAPMRGFNIIETAIDDGEWDGDLDLLPSALPGDVRARVAADSDQCAWRACPLFNDCYVRKMRDRAREAQVIVVNHTLLLLDAAMGGFLLPERDVVVIDEAHHLEEEATRAFTATVTPSRVNSLLSLRKLREIAEERVQREVSAANAAAWEALRQVIGDAPRGRLRLDRPLEEGARSASKVGDLEDSLQRQRPLNMTDKDEQLFERLVKRTRALASDIRTVFAVDKPDERVYYVEMIRSGRRDIQQPSVSAAPLGVTSLLREQLFDRVPTIATSATLAIDGDFRFYRARVGLEAATEAMLPYAFDYATHALLYVPRMRRDPAFGVAPSGIWTRWRSRCASWSRRRADGRSCSSAASARSGRGLQSAGRPRAGSQPTRRLAAGRATSSRRSCSRQFRERDRAVLFGLKSFWKAWTWRARRSRWW